MKSQKPPTLPLLILIVAGTVAGTLLVATSPTRTASKPDSVIVIESPANIDSQGMKATNGGLTMPRSVPVSKSNPAPGRVQGVKIVVNN
ncbi:MAG TPA: hypothetical protein VMS21_09120 [Methylomirabilota bacterium]|nr:hypothetical protein [Methylomirabilota bacterium]